MTDFPPGAIVRNRGRLWRVDSVQDQVLTATSLDGAQAWREGEAARRVDHLVNAFAKRPHLPKMLKRQAILDTLINGCVEGFLALLEQYPDLLASDQMNEAAPRRWLLPQTRVG